MGMVAEGEDFVHGRRVCEWPVQLRCRWRYFALDRYAGGGAEVGSGENLSWTWTVRGRGRDRRSAELFYRVTGWREGLEGCGQKRGAGERRRRRVEGIDSEE